MTTDVVIPAHDEAATVAEIVAACVDAPSVGQVIVVADSCTDDTVNQADLAGALVLTIDAADKGSAMAAGLAQVVTDDVLFIDADLEGFAWQHAEGLVRAAPVGGMVVGLRDEPLKWGARLLPPISGERRLPAALARSVNLAGQGYRAEILIDAAVGKAHLPHRAVVMVGVSNPTRAATEPVSWVKMWVQLVGLCIGLAPELWGYLTAPSG